MEEYYGAAAIIFAFANLLGFVLCLAYYYIIKGKNDISETEDKRGVAILIIGQALFGIGIGSVILFGGLPLIGKFINELASTVGFDKAINDEEIFLINFCVFFGYLSILILNGALSYLGKGFVNYVVNLRDEVPE